MEKAKLLACKRSKQSKGQERVGEAMGGKAQTAHLGVLIMTSEEHLSQPLWRMIAGRLVLQSFLYITRDVQRSKAEWNASWCGDLREAEWAASRGVSGGKDSNRQMLPTVLFETPHYFLVISG